MTASPALPASRLGPAAAAVIGIGLLSMMDGIIKHVSANHSTFQVVLLRYAFGALAAYAVFRITRTPWPNRATLRPHAWRSVVVALTAITFFYSLATLPLAVALALSFTSPLFIALFAALMLGERPGREIFLALGLGFAGVLVVLWGEIGRSAQSPHDNATTLGIAAALVSAVAYALSMVALKSRAGRDPIPTIVLLQNMLAGLLVAPLAAFSWTPPTVTELAFFVLIGLLGAAGHLSMAWAYKHAEASRLGVFEYTAFVWAVGIGLLAFGEVPSIGTLLGAALIVGGATLVSRSPKVTAQVPNEPEAEIGP